MNKMLLVVDPQMDFISGTLAVDKAKEKMLELARYVREKDGDYRLKVVTMDWHPYSHCSFQDNGGQWPRHCVQNTVGAAFFPHFVMLFFKQMERSYACTKAIKKSLKNIPFSRMKVRFNN